MPRISVSPGSELQFGHVALFGASASSALPETRKVVIFNTGTAPLTVHRIELSPAHSAQPTDELSLIVPEGWTLEDPLEARAGQNFVELELRLLPRSHGTRSWTLRVESSDPVQPTIELPVSATIVEPPPCSYSVSPTRFQLSPVFAPDHRDVVVTLHNEGSVAAQQCLVTSVELEGGGLAVSLGQPVATPRVLRARESLEIPVRVTSSLPPQSRVDADLVFEISSESAPLRVPIEIDFGPLSCLTIAPDEVDFGTVYTGCESATKTFNIYNVCGQPAVIRGFSLTSSVVQPGTGGCTGASPCPEFLLVHSPALPPAGLSVLPGASPVTLQVKYRPLDTGSDTAALQILTGQDSSEQLYVVSMTGKGDATGTQTDVFVQDQIPEADLLFVIDNSPSMSNEQSSLATNLSAFFQYLKTFGVDYRIAVIDADPATSAEFLTGSSHPDSVLSASSPNVDAQFAAKVNVGAAGSGSPRCLEKAVAALTAPLVTGTNTGFLRPDASLAVHCITDTTDHSPLAVSDYVNDLWSIKGLARKSMLTFNAAGGFTMACPGDQGRLAAAVNQTNGVSASICDPNWHQSFEALGTVSFGQRSTFFLTRLPHLAVAPLDLEIDGAAVANVDASGATVWTYDPVANAIVFDLAFVPEPGQTITVTYSIACFP